MRSVWIASQMGYQVGSLIGSQVESPMGSCINASENMIEILEWDLYLKGSNLELFSISKNFMIRERETSLLISVNLTVVLYLFPTFWGANDKFFCERVVRQNFDQCFKSSLKVVPILRFGKSLSY